MSSRQEINGWIDLIRWKKQGPWDSFENMPLMGQAITILGGGPGLTMGKVAYLSKYPTICVNNSFMLLDHRTCVVALDRRWWGWHGANVQARGDLGITTLRTPNSLPPGFSGKVMEKVRTPAFVPERWKLAGISSGQAALHLAMHAGAQTIYLAGFDLTFRDGKTHWHEGHVVPSSESNYRQRFRPAMEEIVKEGWKRGHSIYAITPCEANIPMEDFGAALQRLEEDHG